MACRTTFYLVRICLQTLLDNVDVWILQFLRAELMPVWNDLECKKNSNYLVFHTFMRSTPPPGRGRGSGSLCLWCDFPSFQMRNECFVGRQCHNQVQDSVTARMQLIIVLICSSIPHLTPDVKRNSAASRRLENGAKIRTRYGNLNTLNYL